MSDEEDYMSDSFLNKINDVKPSLIQNRIIKKQNEREAKKRKMDEEVKARNRPMHVLQQEKMKEGLNQAISTSNKGFELLSKMGYKAGTSLGKNSEAIKVPISIKLRKDPRSGLGVESSMREKSEQQLNNLKKQINASDLSVDEYRKQMREMSDQKKTGWDLRKLQKTCRLLDLDNRIKEPIHPWFWPEEKIPKDSDDEEDEPDESELTDANKLEMLRNFLRNAYFYCDWCGQQYKDAQELLSTCPGTTEEEH